MTLIIRPVIVFQTLLTYSSVHSFCISIAAFKFYGNKFQSTAPFSFGEGPGMRSAYTYLFLLTSSFMKHQSTIKNFTLCLFFVVLCNYSNAQKVWTLKECIDYALQHNISIKQSEITKENAYLGYNQSRLGMLPSLNGSFSHNYNYGRSVDPFSYTFTNAQIQSGNLSLSSSVTVFNGFQLQNTLRESRLKYLAGKYDLDKIRNDVTLNVVSAYLQALYSNDLLTVATDRVDELTKQRDRTKLLTDAGSLTKSSLLDAEAQLAAEEYNRVTAENQLTNAYLSLAQLLELDSITSIKIAVPEAEVSDLSVLSQSPQSIFAAAQNLPEIKSADTKILAAEKSLAVARGARSPRLLFIGSLSSGYSSASQRIAGSPLFNGLTVSGITDAGDSVRVPSYSYNYEKTPYNDQLNQNYNKSFGINLSIPLFNGWTTNTNIQRSRLNLENTKYSAELIRNQLFKSIQQAYADALASQKKYAAAEKSRDAFRESFNYAEKKFNAGLLSSVEFLTTRNNLSKAETDFLQAKYDFIFRVKILDFYSGKPLSL